MLKSQPGWEVVDEAITGREAVEKAERLKPDVVILDISMPVLNGLEAARQIRKTLPRTEILILTMHHSEKLARIVLDAGALGYLSKSDAVRDVVTAVEFLRQHRPFFSSPVARMVLEGFLKPNRGGVDARGDGLTHREREIVQLLVEGKTNKKVAQVLDISVKTAETHRTNIMRKLGLRNMSDLVHYAVRNDIIVP